MSEFIDEFRQHRIYKLIISMQSSAQTTELTNKFTELDTDKLGYLTLPQFKAYLDQQPRIIPEYLLNELFNLLPNAQMNQKSFLVYMMGYRMKLEQLAISRFAMEKGLLKYASASPPQGNNQVRRNSIRFSVASKKSLTSGQKHKLSLSFGKNDQSQSKRYQQFNQILGRKAQDIIAIIKFKVQQAHEQIRSGIQSMIQTAKNIFGEMDQQISKIIDLFIISVKTYGNYVYIIVQVNQVFLTDMVTFLNQLVQTLSPEAYFQLTATLQSNYFKDILKQGSQKKMQDLQVQLNLDINDQTLKKIKNIMGNQPSFNTQQQKMVGMLLLLFQQANLSAQFSNSQKLFNQMGVGQILSSSKEGLGALKQMSILETIQGFIPQSGQVIENLKKYGKGEGQISINLNSYFVRAEFNLEVVGLFDLF